MCVVCVWVQGLVCLWPNIHISVQLKLNGALCCYIRFEYQVGKNVVIKIKVSLLK